MFVACPINPGPVIVNTERPDEEVSFNGLLRVRVLRVEVTVCPETGWHKPPTPSALLYFLSLSLSLSLSISSSSSLFLSLIIAGHHAIDL